MTTTAPTPVRPVELVDGSAKSCDRYTEALRGDRTAQLRASMRAAELAAFCR